MENILQETSSELNVMGQQPSSPSEEMPEYNYSAFQINDGSGSGSDNSSINEINVAALQEEQSSSPTKTKDWQRKWTLLLYSVTTILLFADQNLLAPNLSQAADEFGFDDNERDKKLGGEIALAFFVLGAPASFMVGCLADSDSVSRSFLFGLTVLIGEGACMMTYFTTTYTGLYITRALTGFSVGGALPLLSSVLGDWYKPEERSAVMASVGIGTGVGIALGQGIAGFFGPTYGWRLPFLLVSIPALVVAVLVMTTVVDPVRGGSDKEAIDNSNKTEINQEPEGLFIDDGPLIENGPTETDVMTLSKIRLEGLSQRSLNSGTPMVSAYEVTQPLEIKTYGSQDGEENDDESYDNNKSRFAIFKPSTYTQHLATTKELLTSKTVLLTIFQGAPGCVPWGIVNTFLNDYLSEVSDFG